MPTKLLSHSGFPAQPYVILLVLVCFILAAIYPFQPPAVVPAAGPGDEFSAARAALHLEQVARAPHPTGSVEHAAVRAYIVGKMSELGLTPEVQTTAVLRSTSRAFSGATVSNIVGRFPGRRSRKALMLAAHYDSVPGSPGASDDGSGVATLLETARALRAGAPIHNDVIFLLTDGEELGMLGAQAFMAEHPWAKDVGVVLNFEARGSGGPSVLFETSAGNGWLVRQFAATAPAPVAYSFLYEFYRRMPNDTDFSVFKRGGIAGLNFAYAEGWVRYHTMKDSVQNLDLRSLQQDGFYALSLVRKLGNEDLSQVVSGDTVYFSIFGMMLRYSQAWAKPLAACAVLLFALVLIVGFRKNRLTWGGIAAGCFGWLGAALLSAGAAYFVWRLVARTSLVSMLAYGIGYNSNYYAVALLALAAAIMTGSLAALRDLTRGENITVSMLLWWLAAAVATGLFFPGASYLFVWPLAAALPVLGYVLARDEAGLPGWTTVLWTFPAFIGILLFAPLIYGLLTMLSTSGLVPLALATALLAAYLHPLIDVMTATRRKRLTASLSAVAVFFFAVAVLERGYDAENPAADTLIYWLNADSGMAEWITTDARPDEWTSQFLGVRPAKGNLNEIIGFDAPILRSPAGAAPLAEPTVAVLGAETSNEIRRLRLNVKAPPQARALWLEVSGAEALELSISGKKADLRPGNKGVKIYYVGIPEGGLIVALGIPSGTSPRLRVTAQCDGLPEIPGTSFRPRPPNLMPAQRPPIDSSALITKSFSLPNMP
jgi:hypothetical protein